MNCQKFTEENWRNIKKDRGCNLEIYRVGGHWRENILKKFLAILTMYLQCTYNVLQCTYNVPQCTYDVYTTISYIHD